MTRIDTTHKDFYNELSNRELHPYIVRGIEYRNRVIAERVGKTPSDVLEVGPGEGWLTQLLAENKHRVTAVDLAIAWLSKVPEHNLAGRAAASITSLPFKDDSFDVVIAAEVIEHVPEIEKALANLARVLRPKGTLVITVPYKETLKFETDPETGKKFEVNGHLHTFDEEKLGNLIRGAGLDLQEHFVGPTRFSREILRRAPIAPLLSFLGTIDRISYKSQRVSDTWILARAVRA
ncbi:MAG: class I SAM-dependent methyltransferase [Candidatus Eisenbacteria bacterium]|uniref:Class I SAM-dependent methyltransferase n=1 Tax=Eiseniibacteriota bacterium TaxID=2212470 RepID=A0A7Y2H3T7_UNCEI|nr:class I SAM-dependent methyltransferase [Candidatus Eisenbacteria bacterium]